MTGTPTLPDAAEPYPFGTRIDLVPGGRHLLMVAYVCDSAKTSDGYRYRCLFPCADEIGGVRVAKVYSEEIAAVGEVDEPAADKLLGKLHR